VRVGSTSSDSSSVRRTPVVTSIAQTPATVGAGGISGTQPALERAIEQAQQALLAKQNPAGYWVAELQGDSILESEYILLKFILGQEDDPQLPKITNYLRGLQHADGGWGLFPGGKADLSGTVKAYFALKLMGDDPDAPHMAAAREVCRKLGGAEQCNSYTNFFLAGLGQISYDACPSIPPEIVFLPSWMYFSLYAVSAWTRTMILPLAIVSSHRPVRRLPEEKGIAELFTGGDPRVGFKLKLPTSWRDFFLVVDQMLKLYQKTSVTPTREMAIKAAEKWLLEHMEGSEGLGAIFPPMVYILVVMRVLGYPDDHPKVVEAHRQLRDLFIEEGDTIRIQPCFSPVWDTGLALHALAEAGVGPGDEAAATATQWLLDKECRVGSDWTKSCPDVEPSGWFFEFENPHYPDVDDTAMVVMAMKRAGGKAAQPAIRRGLKWLLALQNDDGGWAAFDKTKDRPILEHVPFADHNAMQDPSCPDITGRVLECFGHCGIAPTHPAVRKAVEFLRQQQDKDGAWFGRWGVNYVYGTWQVLTGLQAVGERMDLPYVRRAANWLRSVQKNDGSFGESCESYADAALKGQGESTASQTAWGAMGLMASADAGDPAVKKAIAWLVENQAADGAWDEHYYTGTGFPQVFYLKYHLYRLYFPLTALARFRRLAAKG